MFFTFLLKLKEDPSTGEKINELEEIMRQNRVPPFLHSMYVGWKIYFLRETNQIEQAKQVFQEEGMSIGEKITHANETAYISFAHILLDENRLEDAEKLLSKLHDQAEKGKRVERLIDIKILYAIMYKSMEQRETAISSLMQAIELASEENIITYFISKRAQIEDLLQEVYKIQATRETRIPKQYLENLQIAFKKRESLSKRRDDNELSSREIDTLKLIALGLSNQEIADKLFISQNTVKTHLKNVNLKLETDSRTMAVSKAKRLGIIS